MNAPNNLETFKGCKGALGQVCIDPAIPGREHVHLSQFPVVTVELVLMAVTFLEFVFCILLKYLMWILFHGDVDARSVA